MNDNYRESALDVLMIVCGQGIVHCSQNAESDPVQQETRLKLSANVERSLLLLGIPYPEIIESSKRVHARGQSMSAAKEELTDEALFNWLDEGGK